MYLKKKLFRRIFHPLANANLVGAIYTAMFLKLIGWPPAPRHTTSCTESEMACSLCPTCYHLQLDPDCFFWYSPATSYTPTKSNTGTHITPWRTTATVSTTGDLNRPPLGQIPLPASPALAQHSTCRLPAINKPSLKVKVTASSQL